MQFRSLFGKIFGKAREYKDVTALKLLNGYTNMYTPFSGNAYDDATVRDCIDTIARHFGKMRPKLLVLVKELLFLMKILFIFVGILTVMNYLVMIILR